MNPVIVLLLITFAISFAISFGMVPKVIETARKRKILGVDVNKSDKTRIPEMGGFAMIIGIIISLIIAAGIEEYLETGVDIKPLFATFGVIIIAALIGITDDLGGMVRARKAVYLLVPALPLIIFQSGYPVIYLPLNYIIDLRGIPLLYWFIVVPLGITGAANALNMCAGYNGLESGSAAIISFFLLLISYSIYPNGTAVLIFAALLGGSLALYLFNKYPARMFLGDVGVLTLGATIAAGTIVGNIEFYGVLCFLPAFYELFATIYYGIVRGVERRPACINPVILEDGRLKPPKGAEKYTLAFFILGKKPMTEKNLVNAMLSIYALFGAAALVLSRI